MSYLTGLGGVDPGPNIRVSTIKHCQLVPDIAVSKYPAMQQQQVGERKGNLWQSIKMLWPTIFPRRVSMPEEIDTCRKTGRCLFPGPSINRRDCEAERCENTSQKNYLLTTCIYCCLITYCNMNLRLRTESGAFVKGNSLFCQASRSSSLYWSIWSLRTSELSMHVNFKKPTRRERDRPSRKKLDTTSAFLLISSKNFSWVSGTLGSTRVRTSSCSCVSHSSFHMY